jgi:hypothetical protein
LLDFAADAGSRTGEEAKTMGFMRRMKWARRRRAIRRIPLFPFIPVGPALLMLGSVVAAFRALSRVRRLERDLGRTPV